MTSTRSRCSTALSSVLAASAFLGAAAAQTPAQTEFFEKKVRPVLANSCQGCHNAKLKTAGLDLSTAAGFYAGGQSGPEFDSDKLEDSRILKAIGYDESLKMPPTGKLKKDELDDLTEWVKMGAPWPGHDHDSAPAPATAVKKEFTPAQKSFWAFQPVKDPAPPKVANQKWIQSPVDRFILAKLEEKGLKPAPPAGKLTLLRRATFDLTGLPPTAQELQAFVDDQSPKAFEKVVDRLLASPRYGERWGRHWLDVARYADSTGNDEDHRYPYSWRYRDYVIEAFNQDLPYSQFLREQIAGDLLPPGPNEKFNRRGMVATGFLALGAKALAQVDKQKMMYDIYDEQVDVTSKAFMGVTMACARCHDHKFDPILTKDYYSWVGTFASVKDFSNPALKPGVSAPLYRPLVPEAEYQAYQAGQAKIALAKLAIDEFTDKQLAAYQSELASHLADYMLAARQVAPDSKNLPDIAKEKKLNPDLLTKWVAFFTQPEKEPRPFLDEWRSAPPEKLTEVAEAYQKRYREGLDKWNKTVDNFHAGNRKKLEANGMAAARLKFDGGKGDRFFGAVYSGGGPFMADEKVLTADAKAQVAKLREAMAEVKQGAPPEPDMADAIAEDTAANQKVLIRGDYHNLGEDAPRAIPAILTNVTTPPAKFTGSGRLELANWLTEPEHPLTSRVMVNRLWTWHFGEGIVNTPDNFGRMGGRPSHPELLDYLAKRFVESGWSVKAMQRMIMLSSTYQMSSDGDAKSVEADPEDTLLSRFQRQRLSVEQMRDGMLAIDGTLDLTMGGTLQNGSGGDSENGAGRLSLNPETVKRRTVYLPLRRANLPSILNLFDFGDATTEMGKRSLTNVAPQALFMMNSEFVTERAKNIAKAVLDNAKLSNRERVEQMYFEVLDRKPAAAEIDSAFTYMESVKQKFKAADLDAWQSFCHILLGSNEFMYLD
jgi:cytochrome c551/c552